MMGVFWSGGIGDVIAVESFLTNKEKKEMGACYYGTRAWHEASQLFIHAPSYLSIRSAHHLVFKAFSPALPCFISIEQARHRPLLAPMPANTKDYSISKVFREINLKNIPYNGSTFVKDKLADIVSFGLPKDYFVIVPYTTADFRTTNARNFDPLDWQTAYRKTEEWGLTAVVINPHTKMDLPLYKDSIYIKSDASIVESIEIVKGAKGFVGVDSALSVIATKFLTPDRLLIKNGEGGHLNMYKNIYYAPQTDFSFIKRSLH